MPKKNTKKTAKFKFKPLDWLCIAVGIFASILTILIDHDHAPIYITASLLSLNGGVMEAILGINGRRSNYIFAATNAVASICIASMDQFYGNMAINIYYIPLCIFGFYSWGKHRDKNKDVIARKLTAKQTIIAILAFIALSTGLNLLLEHLGGHFTILDSTTTILIIFASILGALRYREQWLLWILADTLMLIMWINVGNPAILTMRAFYPLASIYGYINWRKLVKN